ncbi:hypothetical protein PAPHI01_2333 [Pancytospora philotis]|nr:hypothetical protein PAPHI01_2333 [Pancytospora philotis]
MIYKCGVKISPYAMTWDGVVIKRLRKNVGELGILPNVEAYIQSRVLRGTQESVSFDAQSVIPEMRELVHGLNWRWRSRCADAHRERRSEHKCL